MWTGFCSRPFFFFTKFVTLRFPFLLQSTDTDLVFDDLLDDNVHAPLKNAHSVNNKRSISDENERDIDVEELMHTDDSDEHWLWGSVKRIRRSIDKLLGTENPSEVSETTEQQPKSVKKPLPKHRKKVLVSEDKQRKNKKTLKNDGKSKVVSGKKRVMRPKRQDYDDLDEDDDEDDEDDEILDPVSSGNSFLPELYPEGPEKEDRLCKYSYH